MEKNRSCHNAYLTSVYLSACKLADTNIQINYIPSIENIDLNNESGWCAV